jgi:uncharacterized protein (DUF2062 family)
MFETSVPFVEFQLMAALVMSPLVRVNVPLVGVPPNVIV